MVRLADGGAVRALVVDDVAENRDVLAKMLAVIGCEVTVAENGEQALAELARDLPHLAFIDVMMPGMSGAETAAEARRRLGVASPQRSVRLVATSASAMAHERTECQAAGFEDFLAKPVRYDRLHDCVLRLAGTSVAAAASGVMTTLVRQTESGADLILLPSELRRRLAAAARTYRVTELKRCVEDVEALGPWAMPAGEFLRRCARRYDMTPILAALGDDTPGPAGPQAILENVMLASTAR